METTCEKHKALSDKKRCFIVKAIIVVVELTEKETEERHFLELLTKYGDEDLSLPLNTRHSGILYWFSDDT